MAQAPNPFEQQKPIEGVSKIIAIASGKGGVGKSTVASNLAVSMAKKGLKVGLLDADIYGPSVPRLFGCVNQKPEVTDNNRILPMERYGVKLMSIGFMVEEDSALVWRGPMLFKAMDQLLRDVLWGELDYLLIDLPPGTGDVQLSLAQKIPLHGALVVTTPQNISLIDVKKAVNMFERVNTKVLGMIENMAYFLGPNGEKFDMFPKGELEAYLDAKKLKILCQLPFAPPIALAGEAGVPILYNKESAIHEAFENIFTSLEG